MIELLVPLFRRFRVVIDIRFEERQDVEPPVGRPHQQLIEHSPSSWLDSASDLDALEAKIEAEAARRL